MPRPPPVAAAAWRGWRRLPLLAVLLLLPLTVRAATDPGYRLIAADNPDYVYAGRIGFGQRAQPALYWAGSSATIGFTGSRLGVVLDDPAGGVYFDVIVDGNGAGRHVILCRKGRHAYVVATGLSDSRHVVEIVRRVDPTLPVARFDGVRIASTARVFRPVLRRRLRIEFYGDSITSGYGVLAPGPAHQQDLAYMDSYASYAAVAARALDADYRSISLSGIGILASWFPLTMPEMHDRLAPRDPASRWNFSRWTPDVVVVNLLQNDSWLLPREKHPPAGRKIVDAYAAFVRSLRAHYPQATIICMLGDMDATRAGSPWPGYVEAAVRRLRDGGDPRVHTLIVPYKGTAGHPDVAAQRSMARALEAKIRSIGLPGRSRQAPTRAPAAVR